MNNENIEINNKMNSLESEKAYWEESVLRITTLYSEDEIDGEVFLPIIPTSVAIGKIIVPVGGRKYIFLFKQTCSD